MVIQDRTRLHHECHEQPAVRQISQILRKKTNGQHQNSNLEKQNFKQSLASRQTWGVNLRKPDLVRNQNSLQHPRPSQALGSNQKTLQTTPIVKGLQLSNFLQIIGNRVAIFQGNHMITCMRALPGDGSHKYYKKVEVATVISVLRLRRLCARMID